MNKLLLFFCCASLLAVNACKPGREEDDLKPAPVPYVLNVPYNWPKANMRPDNPLTVEGVNLGKQLFYDPILSGNNTQACASCHNQAFAFTDDGKRFSTGSEGDLGTRNAMPLYNLNWSSRYFWDGRASDLETLMDFPITAHFEMNQQMEAAVTELKATSNYPGLFTKAFPDEGITTKTIRYALAQFVRSIVAPKTKFSEYFQKNPVHPENLMSDAQKRGYLAFISEAKGDCFHCHSPLTPFFINLNEREFSNNGLESQPDSGLFKVTGDPNDRGKFKTPSLVNVLYTAPYMHDGRFNTIEEVLEHYNTGIKFSPTTDKMIQKHLDIDNQPIPRLTAQDKADIIEFLKLLTDSSVYTNPAYSR